MYRRRIVCLLWFLLLTACGGSDSDDTATQPHTPTAPVVSGATDGAGTVTLASDVTRLPPPYDPDTVAAISVLTDHGAVGQGRIIDDTVSFLGVAPANHRVEVTLNGQFMGTVMARTDGTWSFDNSRSPLAVGAHAVTTVGISPADSRTTAPETFTFTYDPSAPVAPLIGSVSDDTRIAGDGVTSDNTLLLFGTAESGARVDVYVNDTFISDVEASADGNWTFDYRAASLPDGLYRFSAEAILYGMRSAVSVQYPVLVDTQAPVAPAVSGVTPDTGSNNADGLTRSTTWTLGGTAEPGASVTVLLGGAALASTTAAIDGTWSLAHDASSLTDGSHLISARAMDAAGNTSAVSAPYTVQLDRSAPATITSLSFAPDTGAANDGITANGALTWSGTGPIGQTVEVFLDGSPIGSAQIDGAGAWSLDASATPVAEGQYAVTATVRDAAGNTSTVFDGGSLVVDASEPLAPSVTAFANDTGVAGDGLTRDTGLLFSGTAEAGASVAVYLNGGALGSVTATPGGTWSFDHSAVTLADGIYGVEARATDGAGNVSPLSATLTVTVDTATTAPDVETISDDTGTAGDGITSDNTLTIAGSAEPGAQVAVLLDGSAIGTVSANGGGIWSLDYTGVTLAEGNFVLTALATDVAGNTAASSAFALTVDRTAAAPVITGITDDTGTPDDGLTSDAELIFAGTAEANARIELFRDGSSLGTTTADSSGDWTFDHSGVTLADGSYAMTAQAEDTAGNVSVLSGAFSLQVDSVSAAPVVTAISTDTGTVGDGVTADNTLQFSGTSEADASVEVFVDAVSVGTAAADSSGNWSYSHTPVLADGAHTITAQATDLSGNTSPVSADYLVTVDTATATPAVTAFTTDTATTGDGITRDDSLSFSGTSEANAAVDVALDGTVIGTATADGSGNWTFDHTLTPLDDGTYAVTAEATDPAGNVSAVSAALNFTVDTSIAQPSVEGISADTGTAGDGITSDTSLIFSGTSESNASVQVLLDGSAIGTTSADSAGDWNYDHTASSLGEGSYAVTAVATDVAGNVSIVSSALALVVDTSATAPAVTSISADTGTAGDGITSDRTLVVNGTGEAATTVEVFRNGTSLGTETVAGDGSWSFDSAPASLADGAYTFTAAVTDKAGNTSAASSGFAVTVDGQAPGTSTFSPANGATGVVLAADLSVTFDEIVYAGSGNLVIHEKAGGAVVETIPMGDARVTGMGTATLTLNPTDPLVGGTEYYVTIDSGWVTDLAGNSYAGISGDATWAFTTVDFTLAASTPADEATNVALDTGLTLVFSEPAYRGTGTVLIRQLSDDAIVEAIDVATAGITGAGTSTLALAFPDTLAPSTAYYLEIAAGAFENANGVAYAGITGNTDLNFTTITSTTPTITNVTSSLADGTYRGGDVIPVQVTFSELVNVTGTPRLQLNLDGYDKFINYTSGSGSNTLQFDYRVTTGDATGDLAYTSAAALERNNGSIRNADQANADLTLPTPGAAGSLSGNKNIVITAAALDITDLSLSDGFFIQGYEVADQFGRSLGAGGDINGDGYEDIVIGVNLSDIDAGDAGAAYVIFGKPGATRAHIDVGALDASDGFLIHGADAADYLGMTVDLSGDLNGDGYDDVVVIASHDDTVVTNGGTAYVIWGQAGATRTDINVSTMTSADGFRILSQEAGDFLGNTTVISPQNSQFVDADGDFNGDGIDDLLLGHGASDNDGGDSGLVYVIFGQTGATRADINLSSLGSEGFKITTGGAAGEHLGHSVQFLGDFNGDGLNDVIVGAPRSGQIAGDAGQAYVILGHAGPTYNSVNLMTLGSAEGFKISTSDGVSWLGGSVSGSDVNGDGLTDLLVGNVASDEVATDAGSLIVVYGRSAANYSNISVGAIPAGEGYTIFGEGGADFFGHAVEGAGDINGDGIGDLLVSSWVDDEGGGDAGAAWLVYGKPGTARTDIQLSTLSSANGFKIIGDEAVDYFGRTNAIGDINGDGYDDMIVSSALGNNTAGDAGEINVIWGKDFLSVVDADLVGTGGADYLVGTSASETIMGAGGADRISAGAGDDIIEVSDLAFARIDGGRGEDVLALTGDELSLDLRAINYEVIRGIEAIDLRDLGNGLTVSKASLLALSSQVRTLYVRGGSSDWVAVDGAETWTANGTATVNAITYDRYDLGEVSLFVQSELSQPAPPDAPVVLAFSNDTGAAGDGITGDTGLVFSGSSGAYDGIEVFLDGAPIGTADADGSGLWSFNYSTTPLGDGAYAVTAQATNGGGYVSVASAALNVIVDTGTPVPAVTAISVDTGTVGDGVTGDNTLIFSGTSEADAAVEILLNGSGIGTAVADASGNWSFDHTAVALSDGAYSVTAQATDVAGNVSSVSPAFNVIVDATEPAPVINGISDDTGTAGDGITQDTTLLINGTSASNASVAVFIDGALVGTTAADGSGDWSYDRSAAPFSDGTYAITAQATDIAGNVSALSVPFGISVDTSADTPSITGISNDTGAPGDGITSDTTLTFNGTSEADASVEVALDGTTIGTATADGSGNWSYSYGTALSEGSYSITARIADLAGNVSAASAAFGVVVDTTPPLIASLDPMDGATDVPLAADLTIDFDETVYVGSGDIIIRRANDNSIFEQIPVGDSRVTGDGTSSLTINPATEFELFTDYYVQMAAGTVTNGVGNAFAGITDTTTWNFTSENALLLNASSPADGDTGVALGSDLTLTFNQVVTPGSGQVRVRESGDGTLFEAVSVTSLQVTGAGTSAIKIEFSDTLVPNTGYYVEVDATAFNNGAGKDYEGIADSTTLNFTSANVTTPTVTNVTSSVDGSHQAGEVIPVLVTFSEAVVVEGVPQISLKLDDQDKAINYTSGSGADTLTFAYTVAPGDTTPELTYVDENSLNRNGGSIRSLSDANANLTLAQPGLAYSLSFNRNISAVATVLDITGLSAANGFFVRGHDGGEFFGSALAAGGDVNGDGFEDYLVSVSEFDENGVDSGAVWVVYGRPGSTRANINLGTFGIADGFRIIGFDSNETLGTASSMSGELNGDGLDDIVLGAGDSNEGALSGGAIYVIWGKAQATRSDIWLSSLSSSDGFDILAHESGQHLGSSTETDPLPVRLLDHSGDFNGDGINDLVIGHPLSDVDGTNSGVAYVILGTSSATRSRISLGALGSQGFRIRTGGASAQYLGNSVRFIGDYNGDGRNDLIIGEVDSDTSASNAGRAYLIFGQSGASFADIAVSSLDGLNGFALTSNTASARLGSDITGADINGDGYTDLVVGQEYASPNSRTRAGRAAVIYGNTSLAPYANINIETLAPGQGFVIQGESASDYFGHATCTGDLDADGIDDLLVSGWGDSQGGGADTGAAWVLYGKPGYSRADIDLAMLSGADGFKMLGDGGGDHFGKYCAVGDINGDSYDDLLLTSQHGDDLATNAGELNVIWGRDFQALGFGRLTGNPSVNHLVGTDGNDTIDGKGGADTVVAGSGDDIILVSDLAFTRIDGGRGLFDTLALTEGGLTLDLTALGYEHIRNLEVIDLAGLGNTLTLTALDLLAISDESSELYVMGGADDSVSDANGSGWSATGSTSVLGATFNVYTRDGATLYVEGTVSQSGL
ncbi:MAG: hypothetical protein CL583_03365 [Alteromonadaceae bacterium]|nr:hypothetical protein [Alteromonadaceae bacterium]